MRFFLIPRQALGLTLHLLALLSDRAPRVGDFAWPLAAQPAIVAAKAADMQEPPKKFQWAARWNRNALSAAARTSSAAKTAGSSEARRRVSARRMACFTAGI